MHITQLILPIVIPIFSPSPTYRLVLPGGPFLMGTEIVGPKWRPIAGNIVWIFWTLGMRNIHGTHFDTAIL